MTVSPPDSSAFLWEQSHDHPAPLLPKPQGLDRSGPTRSPTKNSDSNGSQKSASRARRQSQNREAQRVFRQRQRERFETQEKELNELKLRYQNLSERHENLRILYMDLLRQRGVERGESISKTALPEAARAASPVDGRRTSEGRAGARVGEWLFG